MADVPWRKALIKKSKKKANSCVQDVEQVLKHFQNLHPGLQDFTYNDGVQKELFSLDGTIPVNITGVTYNIPVCVLLQEGHPEIPPLVYVRPTSTMAIKESQYVDKNGRVYHPYLHKWKNKSNIVALLQNLCAAFGNYPPVYSKPLEQSPPPRSAYQPAPSTSADHRPRSGPQQTPSTGADYPPRSAHQQRPSTGAEYPPRATQKQPAQEQPKECVVCMDSPRNSVLLPCGHLGVCMECAKEIQRTTKICPICRKRITQFNQVYDV